MSVTVVTALWPYPSVALTVTVAVPEAPATGLIFTRQADPELPQGAALKVTLPSGSSAGLLLTARRLRAPLPVRATVAGVTAAPNFTS